MKPSRENYVSTPLKQVLQGQFPAKDVKKMDTKTLEKFVLALIQHSIADGAKTKKSFISVCNGFNSKQIIKPAWWPSELILGSDFPSNSSILLTSGLRLLVLHCAEFFRKSCDKFVKELYNDEHHTGKHTEAPYGVKRKRSPIDVSTEVTSNEVEVCFNKKHITIPLTDILNIVKDEAVEETKDQTRFLGNLFGLSQKEMQSDHNSKKIVIPSSNHHVIKLTNSNNIPFTSNIGRVLIERDAHYFPESLCVRKCDRLEWYINKIPQNVVEVKYEVTYHETKKSNSAYCHVYKFPKRQFCQYQYPTKFQLEVCKPLKISLRRDNLEMLKKTWKTPRILQVVLPKIPQGRMKCQDKGNEIVQMKNKPKKNKKVAKIKEEKVQKQTKSKSRKKLKTSKSIFPKIRLKTDISKYLNKREQKPEKIKLKKH